MRKNQKGEFLSSRVRYIAIGAVRPNPQQPRRSFDETALRELADSIRAYGILQPLTVRDKGGYYELVAGERRLRAARMAGLREVPCLIAAVGEEDAALLALIENLQRRDLDYLEEAAAISRLIGRYGLSQQQAAEKLGKSQPAIANKLRLLRLGPPVTDCLRQYGLTERHARALLRLTDPEQQLAAARHMGQRGLNVAQAEQYIDALGRPEPDGAAAAASHVHHQGRAAVPEQRGAGRATDAVGGRRRGGRPLRHGRGDPLDHPHSQAPARRGCYGFVTHFPQGYGIMGWHRVPLWRKGRRGTSMEENIVSSVKTTEAADGARLEQIAPEKPPVSGGRKAGLIVGIVVGVLALAYIAACAVVQFLYNDTALPHTDVLGVDVSGQAAQQIEALWEQQGERVLHDTAVT